jgi:hypothetical protein
MGVGNSLAEGPRIADIARHRIIAVIGLLQSTVFVGACEYQLMYADKEYRWISPQVATPQLTGDVAR